MVVKKVHSTGAILLEGVISSALFFLTSHNKAFLYQTGRVLIVTHYLTGIVKWYDDSEGHGFIASDHGGEVYVHYSAVQCDEIDCSLGEGYKVRFTVINGPKGQQAQDVVVLETNK